MKKCLENAKSVLNIFGICEVGLHQLIRCLVGEIKELEEVCYKFTKLYYWRFQWIGRSQRIIFMISTFVWQRYFQRNRRSTSHHLSVTTNFYIYPNLQNILKEDSKNRISSFSHLRLQSITCEIKVILMIWYVT